MQAPEYKQGYRVLIRGSNETATDPYHICTGGEYKTRCSITLKEPMWYQQTNSIPPVCEQCKY